MINDLITCAQFDVNRFTEYLFKISGFYQIGVTVTTACTAVQSWLTCRYGANLRAVQRAINKQVASCNTLDATVVLFATICNPGLNSNFMK